MTIILLVSLQIVKEDGEFQGFVDLSRGCLRPSDIHLTPDNFLCVTSYLEHCVKVYKLSA